MREYPNSAGGYGSDTGTFGGEASGEKTIDRAASIGAFGSIATRRGFIRAGCLGLSGLTLADFLRARDARADSLVNSSACSSDDLSVILVWLDGGPPQHETYDPKPEAPAEFRGEYKTIASNVPGIFLSEHTPYQARHMDKLTLLRSMHHNNGDHFAAAHWMLTGFLGSNAANLGAQYPSAGSIVAKLKGARKPGIPPYVGLPRLHSVGLAPGYHGAAYLGVGDNPFTLDADPNNASYRVRNLTLPVGVDESRLEDRRSLLRAFDTARSDVDASGLMEGLDRFSTRAYQMISGPDARAAFDLSKEDPKLRDRYGRTTVGQSALLARRLVEAGVRFVTVVDGGWDYHANLFNNMKKHLNDNDRAVGSLIEDLHDRGMLERTIVIVMGEFGRTPRVNATAGRDHWGEVMSVMLAGGGFPAGRTVGSSSARGEYPRDLPVRPQDLIVTLYRKLGIDPLTTFVSRSGRPAPVGGDGRAIVELL